MSPLEIYNTSQSATTTTTTTTTSTTRISSYDECLALRREQNYDTRQSEVSRKEYSATDATRQTQTFTDTMCKTHSAKGRNMANALFAESQTVNPWQSGATWHI